MGRAAEVGCFVGQGAAAVVSRWGPGGRRGRLDTAGVMRFGLSVSIRTVPCCACNACEAEAAAAAGAGLRR
jgi:hypothetical protein